MAGLAPNDSSPGKPGTRAIYLLMIEPAGKKGELPE